MLEVTVASGIGAPALHVIASVDVKAPARLASGRSFAARVVAGAEKKICPRCGLPYLASVGAGAGSCDECCDVIYNEAPVPTRWWRQREILWHCWEEQRETSAATHRPKIASRKRRRNHAVTARPSVVVNGPLLMDAEAWFSVTPQSLADYVSVSVGAGGRTVLDLFAGAGGNTVAFARGGAAAVIAVDSCRTRLDMARANAAHDAQRAPQDVPRRSPIFFVHGDAVALLAEALAGLSLQRAPESTESVTSSDNSISDLAESGIFSLDESAPRRCVVVGVGDDGRLRLSFSAPGVDAHFFDVDVCFAAPPWGGEGYLRPHAPATSSSRSTDNECSDDEAAAAGDARFLPAGAAAALASSLRTACGGVPPLHLFNIDAGLALRSTPSVALALCSACAQLSSGSAALAQSVDAADEGSAIVGGAIMLTALAAVFAHGRSRLALYLPRNCARARALALLARGSSRPLVATVDDLFLDDRREATALLMTAAEAPMEYASGSAAAVC